MADSHLTTLLWLLDVAKTSLTEAPADKRASLIAQVRGITAEIAELGGYEVAEPEGTGLSEFQRRLADRRAASSSSGKSTG